MATRMRIPQAAGIRQSVEMQHSKRGVGRMFRRGLHGSKNWVLELDEDGNHRSVGSKALRAAIVLLPFWVLLSAFTGGPERGGKATSVGQSLFMATLVTLLILAFFSARERKLGNEEPWLNLPSVGTDGDDGEAKTKVDPSSEAPTELSENPQVSELAESEKVVTEGDNPDEEDHSSQIEAQVASEVVTQAIPQTSRYEVFDQFNGQVTPVSSVENPVVSEAKTQVIKHHIPDALEEETPTVPLGGGHPARQAAIDAPVEQEFSQVIDPFPAVSEAPQGGPAISLEKVTESESDHLGVDLVQPVTQAVIRGTQEPLFSQVSEGDHPVIPPVTTPTLAQMGPYKVTTGPLSEDWWRVAPDLPEEEAAESEGVVTEGAMETSVEPVVITTQETSGGPLLGYAPEVVTYFAVRSMPNATEDVKDEARREVIAWLRVEIEAGRLSQRSAAQLLDVSKTTIANWLSDDPWTVQTEEVE